MRPDYITGSGTTPVTAGSFVTGVVYSITTVGTTDFTAIGASANTVGVEFRATGAGSGTGTATPQAKYDIGCFEFDHGYGPWPATYTLELTGVPSGSEVRCYTGLKDGSAVEIGGTETTTGSSFSFTHSSAGVSGFVHIIHPNYAIQEFDYTYQATNVSIPVQIPADRWYNNP